jgi:hypothetical protein
MPFGRRRAFLNNTMNSINKLLLLFLLAVSLASCAQKGLDEKESASVNLSALYSPTSVTSIKDHPYQFQEGVWKGTGENLYSTAAALRLATLGRKE